MLSLKKSLIFGCALLLTALVFFTGCPSPSSSDIFIQVTDITGVPATGTEGAEVDLSAAKVVPAEANYKTISWSVKEAGTTEVSTEGIVNAKFTPAQPGTLVLTATIANGVAEGTNYTKDFTITIASQSSAPGKPAITSVVPASTTSLTVTWGAVSDATSYEVYHATVGSPMPGTASISNLTAQTTTLSSLTAGAAYQVWVKAVNTDGSTASDPWETVVYDPALLNDLEGLWASEYGEEYIIEDMEFTDIWGGATSYKGPIVNIRKDTLGNSEKGYITIRYTENLYSPDWVGNYYVIRWEDWITGSTIKISGAAPGDGYGTISEAETAYSGNIGGASFTYGSNCYFIAGEGMSSAIIGTWNGEDNYSDFSYTITDKLVMLSMSSTTYFVGEIVNVRTLVNDANYITFKFVTNNDNSLVGKYCVLYWTDLSPGTQTTAKMTSVFMSSYQGDDGKDTQQAAESAYVDVEDDIDSEGPYEVIRQ